MFEKKRERKQHCESLKNEISTTKKKKRRKENQLTSKLSMRKPYHTWPLCELGHFYWLFFRGPLKEKERERNREKLKLMDTSRQNSWVACVATSNVVSVRILYLLLKFTRNHSVLMVRDRTRVLCAWAHVKPYIVNGSYCAQAGGASIFLYTVALFLCFVIAFPLDANKTEWKQSCTNH